MNYSRELEVQRARFATIMDYDVEDITNHELKDDKWWFWTKWKGFTRHWNTWEPSEQFLPLVNSVWKKYVLKNKIPISVDKHIGGK